MNPIEVAAEIIVRFLSLYVSLLEQFAYVPNYLYLRVNWQTIVNRMLARTPANTGDTNQLRTTVPSYFQLTQVAPPTARPEPIIAPTIV